MFSECVIFWGPVIITWSGGGSGEGYEIGGAGDKESFTPTGKGGQKGFSHAKGGGTNNLEVVLTLGTSVLAIM